MVCHNLGRAGFALLATLFLGLLSLAYVMNFLWTCRQGPAPELEEGSSILKEAPVLLGLAQPAASIASAELQREDVQPEDILYGHIHMAKAGGSYVNTELALNFERVCGHKGYSYDAFQANLRYKERRQYQDVFGRVARGYDRLRVPEFVMEEIGYEDCDLVSHEVQWSWWKKFKKWKVEFHLPCRDPVDHILSMCNQIGKGFDCRLDWRKEVEKCIIWMNRFGIQLNSSAEFPNARLKCYNFSMTSKYIQYMSTKLQKKKRLSTLVYRPYNDPRNHAKECLFSNETANHLVRTYMRTLPYYAFCDRCLGSEQDLLL